MVQHCVYTQCCTISPYLGASRKLGSSADCRAGLGPISDQLSHILFVHTQENVLWFDVSVYHPTLIVEVLEPKQNLVCVHVRVCVFERGVGTYFKKHILWVDRHLSIIYPSHSSLNIT